MDEVVQARVIEDIADGPVECQIALTGPGFVVIGEGEIQKVRKDATKQRGKYKKITPRMIYAAEVLTTFGFKPLELMELFGLARRTAYELSKKAKAEIARKMEAREREYQERERISAASLREDWQDRPGKVETARMKEGYSLREARSFKQ
jgi:glycyl-tRNA synthetase (class II)